MKSKDQVRLEESYQKIVEASMMKAISDEAIQRVVDRLNQIDQAYTKGREFKGKLTVDRVKSDERVKNLIFSPENLKLGILRGDDYVSELWNSDRFVELSELLGSENRMSKPISDEAIQRVVNRLNQLDQAYSKGQEFKGKLTVDRVKSDEQVKNMIFSPENLKLGLLRGDDYVSELWNSDRFVELADLLGSENQ